MKKLLLSVAVMVISATAFSQTYKGQWMVGGNASFSSMKVENQSGTVTNINLMPNAGYFFIDNLAGGLRVDLSSWKAENQDAVTDFAAGPFVRYYFLPPAQRTNIFADVAYAFGTTGAGDKEGYNMLSAMAGPAFFLTPNTALEVALRFSRMGGDAYQNTVTSFGVNVGFQIHLGRGSAAAGQ